MYHNGKHSHVVFKSLLLFIITVFTGVELKAQEKDSIFLYNGQVLIGDIKGGKFGTVTIDDTDLKDLEVKLYKIKRINASRRFKIEIQNKTTYYGFLKQSEKNGWVNIVSENGTKLEIDIRELNVLIALDKQFFARLEGSLAAGFSYTKSNALGQMNFSTTILYATEKIDYYLSLSAIGSIDSSTYSRDRENGELVTTYHVYEGWFAAAGFEYQRNLELSIASRYQELLGGGNKLVVKQNWELMAISGITFNQEKSTDGISSGLLMELPLIMRFNFFKIHHPNINISSSQSVFYSLTQQGRVRYEGNISFSWELVHRFYLTFNPYANFDSKPPQGDINFDFGTAVSISYKF